MSVCLGCEKESEEDEEYEQCHKCLDIECDECEENMERRSGLPYFLVCPCGKTHLYRLRHDEIRKTYHSLSMCGTPSDFYSLEEI